MTSPDGAGIRLHHPVGEPDAVKYAAVGGAHRLVTFAHALRVRVKGVGVLHNELARAHHSEARADFVAELRLYLVEIERQLPVGFCAGADDVGYHLLVGGAEAELAAVAVGKAQQLLAVDLPAPGFLPQVGGLNGGQKNFGGSGGVHFLADNRRNFGRDAPAQRQPGIDSSGELADKSRAEHQPVADDFRLGGRFTVSVNEKARRKHGANYKGFGPDGGN